MSAPEAVVEKRKLHHVGFVLASIADSAEGFARTVGASWDGQIVHDPIQQVRVTFLQGASFGDALIELVEPAGESSPVQRFLARGGGLNHLCYEVEDLEKELEASRERGAVIVRPPAPAVAFGGRRIAWVLTPHRLLVEYLERS